MKIGFTCGAFDLCHAGHILMFKECKEYCDYLIVGLHTDPTLDRKTKNKPVQSVEERKIQLEANKYIDKVILYSTEEELLQILTENPYQIDVRIIGADWKEKRDQITGNDLPIPILFNTRSHSYSTSELRKRIFEAEKSKLDTQ